MPGTTVEERLVKVETILETVNKTTSAIFDKLDKRDDMCAKHSETLAIMQAIMARQEIEIKELRSGDIKDIEASVEHLKEVSAIITKNEKRISDLEAINKWLWGTIGASIIAMLINNYSKILSLLDNHL